MWSSHRETSSGPLSGLNWAPFQELLDLKTPKPILAFIPGSILIKLQPYFFASKDSLQKMIRIIPASDAADMWLYELLDDLVRS